MENQIIPALKHKNNRNLAIHKKTFSESLSEGYRFDAKYDVERYGIRSVCYYKEEHSLIISHTQSNRVHVLNLSTGKLRWFDNHRNTVRNLHVDPHNHEILSGSWDGTVHVTDYETLKPRLKLTEKRRMGRCCEVGIDYENNFIYGYSYDTDKNRDRTSNSIRKWNLVTGKPEFLVELPGTHLTTRRCGSIVVSGNRLYSVSDTGHLHILDAKNGEIIREVFLDDLLQSVKVVPEHNMVIVSSSSGNIYSSDLEGNSFRKIRRAHRKDVTHLQIHPDNPDILLSLGFDETLKIWKLPGISLINILNVKGAYLWTSAMINNLILTGGEYGGIFVFEANDLKKTKLKGKLIVNDDWFAYFPEDTNLFYASDLSKIEVRDRNNEVLSDKLKEQYLLNSSNNFNLFRNTFSAGFPERIQLPSYSHGFYQLAR